jgi:hypothetical protein
MWPFTRIASTETVHGQNLHADSDLKRLAKVEIEYRQAEREFNRAWFEVAKFRATHKDPNLPFFLDGKKFTPVFTRPLDARLSALEHDKQEKLDRRNALLNERADLMRKLRLIS